MGHDRGKEWKRGSRELSHASEELGLAALASDSFRVFVERERALAERYGHRFAVVSLDVQPSSRDIQDIAIAQIGERIRETDLVGRGEKGELQVLLRHVDRDSAQEIAERLTAGIVDHAITVHTVIYPYPPPAADEPKV